MTMNTVRDKYNSTRNERVALLNFSYRQSIWMTTDEVLVICSILSSQTWEIDSVAAFWLSHTDIWGLTCLLICEYICESKPLVSQGVEKANPTALVSNRSFAKRSTSQACLYIASPFWGISRKPLARIGTCTQKYKLHQYRMNAGEMTLEWHYFSPAPSEFGVRSRIYGSLPFNMGLPEPLPHNNTWGKTMHC